MVSSNLNVGSTVLVDGSEHATGKDMTEASRERCGRLRFLRTWIVRAVACTVIGSVLFLAISVYVMYQTNQREWQFLHRVEDAGGRATFSNYGPAQMPQWVPNGHLLSQLRIDYVDLVAVTRQADWLAELRS